VCRVVCKRKRKKKSCATKRSGGWLSFVQTPNRARKARREIQLKTKWKGPRRTTTTRLAVADDDTFHWETTNKIECVSVGTRDEFMCLLAFSVSLRELLFSIILVSSVSHQERWRTPVCVCEGGTKVTDTHRTLHTEHCGSRWSLRQLSLFEVSRIFQPQFAWVAHDDYWGKKNSQFSFFDNRQVDILIDRLQCFGFFPDVVFNSPAFLSPAVYIHTPTHIPRFRQGGTSAPTRIQFLILSVLRCCWEEGELLCASGIAEIYQKGKDGLIFLFCCDIRVLDWSSVSSVSRRYFFGLMPLLSNETAPSNATYQVANKFARHGRSW
jgi:hypothetical protein